MVEKGTNYDVLYLLDYINEEGLSRVNEYILENINGEYKEFLNKDEVSANLKEYSLAYLEKLSIEEKNSIRIYTGLMFRQINSVLRNIWDYNLCGKFSEELQNECLNIADIMDKAINKTFKMPFSIKTYRGVAINAFYGYGISKISDLIYMQDKFMYEVGFTSTSILKDKDFTNTKYKWGGLANIKIEYIIPKDSDDGVLLDSEELSFSPNQVEFLIKDSSLFKVLDVKVDKKENKAYLKVILVPQRIWNPVDYERERASLVK